MKVLVPSFFSEFSNRSRKSNQMRPDYVLYVAASFDYKLVRA